MCTALVYKNEMDCSTAYVYILRVCITLYVHIESSILIYKINLLNNRYSDICTLLYD